MNAHNIQVHSKDSSAQDEYLGRLSISDDDFLRSNVPMTKEEVRAIIIHKLRLRVDETVFDIGSGTGSVAAEIALNCKQGRVFAIEQKREASELIKANFEKFGIANIEVLHAKASEVLNGLPAPDAVFIGGSGGELEQILMQVQKLNSKVRICISAISLETFNKSLILLNTHGFENISITQVSVSRSAALGSLTMLKPLNPVFIITAEGR